VDHAELRKKLAATFRAEAEEHLATLDRDLLELERGGDRQELVQELFRAAHSLKGAAAMVEMGEVQRLAHAMEDLLGAVRDGSVEPAPTVIDLLLAGTDGLRGALAAEPGDTAVSRQVDRLVEALRAAARGDPFELPRPPEERSPAVPAAGASPQPSAAQGTGASAAEVAPASTAPVAHIRVPPAALDRLVERLAEVSAGSHAFEDLPGRIATVERRVRDLADDLGRHGAGPTAGPERGEAAALREELDELAGELATWALDSRRRVEEHARFVEEAREAAEDLRMAPLATLLERFPRVVRDTARRCGKRVELVMGGGEVRLDREVLERLADPLLHLVRNAIGHGIEEPAARRAAGKPEAGRVEISAQQRGRLVEVVVRDDGRGMDVEALTSRAMAMGLMDGKAAAERSKEELLGLAFSTGISTAGEVTELSGRGVGLDVVRANLEQLQGRVEVGAEPGRGTVFTMTVPLSLATTFSVLVSCGGTLLALPAATVDRGRRVAPEELGTMEGRPVLRTGDRPLPVVALGAVLGLGVPAPGEGPVRLVVAGAVEHRVAFLVDALEGSRELLVSDLGPQLRDLPMVAGGAILPDGRPVIVLDVGAVIEESILRGEAPTVAGRRAPRRRRVLLADDSLTTRALERTILEGAGYEVVAVADGEAAWHELPSGRFDAVVTDIQMPGLDGFALTRRIRSDPRFRDLPVVLVTSLASSADKKRGLEAGAGAYIVKGAFDQRELLETLDRLVAGGEAP